MLTGIMTNSEEFWDFVGRRPKAKKRTIIALRTMPSQSANIIALRNKTGVSVIVQRVS